MSLRQRQVPRTGPVLISGPALWRAGWKEEREAFCSPNSVSLIDRGSVWLPAQSNPGRVPGSEEAVIAVDCSPCAFSLSLTPNIRATPARDGRRPRGGHGESRAGSSRSFLHEREVRCSGAREPGPRKQLPRNPAPSTTGAEDGACTRGQIDNGRPSAHDIPSRSDRGLWPRGRPRPQFQVMRPTSQRGREASGEGVVAGRPMRERRTLGVGPSEAHPSFSS